MKDDARKLLPPMAMLQSFVKAADYDSFSRAAAELSLTQGAISRQVAALEERGGRCSTDADGASR